MNAAANDDDGSREFAVRELGEQAVREAEVEVVRKYAGTMSVDSFRAMGIPAASIREGLGLDSEGTPRRAALRPPVSEQARRPEAAEHVALGFSQTRGVPR